MIDEDIKQKVIDLYVDGESKKHIEEETGVSQPSIRKILRKEFIDLHKARKEDSSEKGGNILQGKSLPSQSFRKVNKHSDIDPRVYQDIKDTATDIFVVNLTRNWPRKGSDLIQWMKNGIPYWALPEELEKWYPSQIVSDIMYQIKALGLVGNVYEVRVTHNFRDHSKDRVKVRVI